MASRNFSPPPAGPYLTIPFLSAFIATSIAPSGQLKSGSPTAKFKTSFPSDFNCLALALSATVGDGLNREILSDKVGILISLSFMQVFSIGAIFEKNLLTTNFLAIDAQAYTG